MRFCEKTYNVVDYHEVEKAIQDFYGIDEFSVPCDLETSNDTNHSFTIDGKLDQYDLVDLAEFKKELKQTYWRTPLLMNDLCRNDIIPPGDYLISVSW